MLLQAHPCSSYKAAKLKAGIGWSSHGGATEQPLGSLAGAKKIRICPSTEEPPGVACWPLQDKDGAIAGRVHQLLLSLEASGKTHGKQRRGSCRPPQELGAGSGPARKSGATPAGLDTLRDSSFRKAKPSHRGRAIPGDLCGAVAAQLSGALSQHWHDAGPARDRGPASRHFLFLHSYFCRKARAESHRY